MAENVTIQKIHGWRKLFLIPLAICLKLFVATLRVRFSENAQKFLKIRNKSSIIAFWHQNLLVICVMSKKLNSSLPIYGLISPSSDGAWLSAFFELGGVKSIRGSSGRRGASAINELQEKLKHGAYIAITPDGPRGPAKKFKKGVSILALRSKTDITLFSVKYSRFWTLNTWDKFIVPKPFSKVIINCTQIPYDDFRSLDHEKLTLLLEKKIPPLEQ